MRDVSIGGAVAIGIVSLIIVWCCCARRRTAGRVISPPAPANVSAVIISPANPPGPAPYPQQQYITASVPMPVGVRAGIPPPPPGYPNPYYAGPYPQVQQYAVQTAPYPAQQYVGDQHLIGNPYSAGFTDTQPTAPALNSLPPTYDQAVRHEQKQN